MMKKTLFMLLLFVGLGNPFTAHSQIQFDGTESHGRIYDIIYDPVTPDKLYALTQGSHIIYSLDQGQNWEILYSFPENSTSLKELRYIPGGQLSFYVKGSSTLSNNNTIYILDIATQGVVSQSTVPIPNANNVWVSSYSIYEADTNVMMVQQGFQTGISNFAKIYYTTDGGANWTEIYYNTDYDSVFPNNVAISPADPQKLFIARGNGPTAVDGGLFVSEDAGATWEEKLAGNTFGPITFNPSDPSDILLGTSIGYDAHVENLYRSLDDGATWNIVPITWTDGTLDNITGIVYNPGDLNNIIVLEENEIVLTDDNGASWTNHVYPIGDNIHSYYYGLHASFNPFQNGELFINANYYPLFSSDGGITFSQLENPFYPVSSVGIFDAAQDHLYYGVQGGIIHRELSNMQETSFHIKPLNYFSNGSPTSYYVDKYTEGRIYSFESGFTGSTLSVSDDYGETRSPLHTLFADRVIEITTAPNDHNVVWASFLNGEEYIIDFNDLTNVTSTPINPPTDGLLTGVYIDENDTNNIYITLGAEVYRSTDGGNTWNIKSNGINPASTDLIFDIANNPFNNAEFIIATNDGIYKTLDAGENWTQVYSGENVRKVQYSSVTQGHVVAASHTALNASAQIMYSTDQADTWTEIPVEDIEYASSNSIAFYFNPQNVEVYLASYDLGLVKYVVDFSSMGLPDFSGNGQKITVYPNPTKGIIHIESKKETAQQVSVYNLMGQKVLERSGKISEINISNLNRGIYLVKIKSNGGTNFVKKIIKE